MENLTLSDLKPNEQNPRKISDEQLARLKKSIEKFGDLSGFVWNRTTERLSGGHQRQKVIPPDAQIEIVKRFEKPTETGTIAQGFIISGGERFAYREVLWDELTEKAANVAANQHGGEFDISRLAEWVLELDQNNIDLDLLGFSDEELANLMAPINQIGGMTDEDDANEPRPSDTRVVKGDVWAMGNHRLVCGDATVITDVDRLVNGVKADMVWTDPPYNVNYSGKTKDALTIENDSMNGEQFYKFLYDVYSNMLLHMNPGGAIYVAHADTEGANFRKAMVDAGWLLKQTLVWVKQTLVMGRQDYHWKHEPILYGWAPGEAHHWYSDRKQTTVLEFDRPQRNGEHPTMKPVNLIEYMLGNSSKPGDRVMDLFGGSGSTLIACEKMNRKCLTMELDPTYCAVILDRWCKFTGKDPIREDGAKWSEFPVNKA